ncbi:Ig-like domain-containing protein [Aliifodinibius sp. S!AR15-10]|uniref:Ig-like domain-containing protein n=1 Tax=Aliifodinibius sp. S!AR15-10 TaxID=2950437 RepID=UPI00285E32B1|nr:Ig-like domain-containing protein [Aliifodinibius sp. S!AR15-10]MDR8393296.1 Ig-like domain-containing protein [Aliifodinibius sp. S!AR15-10]
MFRSNRHTVATHVKSTQSLIKSLCLLSLAVSVSWIAIFTGCSTDSDMGEMQNQITEIEITPDSIAISAGDKKEFSAFGLTASGDTVQDAEFNWWSTDTDVFTVENDGTVTGQNAGNAFCMIELAIRGFTGRDSAFVNVF